MKKISIIGFGRFGKTLYRLLQDDFEITVFTKSGNIDKSLLNSHTRIAKTIEEVYESDTIFLAVPIIKFESIIKVHKKYFKPHHLIIDVLSVKVYPRDVLKKHLKHMSTQALLTHPMFGPDSSKDGFTDLPFIMNQFTASTKDYLFWKNYFIDKKLRVIEMSPEDHDKYSANSLGVAQFIGRVLNKFHFTSTPIDSLGAIKLQQIMNQACNDTWELFVGLQNYNPYTKQMRIQLGSAYDALYNKLLPKRIHKTYTTFGIQGGKGSFNEQAIKTYIRTHAIKKYRIVYLYTTKKVLKALHEGKIDFGQYAITNSTGGLVEESLQAMAKYRFSIIKDFEIPIEHFLMKRKNVEKNNLTSIMAHSQVFIQCRQTLAKKYPHLQQIIGKGDFIDTAKAAEALTNNRIPQTTAILGPRILADIYNLDIIDEHLQDKKDNLTRFLVVSR